MRFLMVKSIDKGKRGEREVAALLKKYGFKARRGQQYAGGGDSPDVVHDLPWPLHIEVKYTEKFSLYKALAQAISEAKEDEAAIVFYRRTKKQWVVVMDADVFLEIMQWL